MIDDGCDGGGVGLFVVSWEVGGNGGLAANNGALSTLEMGFEADPSLVGERQFVPSADVSGKDSGPSYVD